MPKHPILKKV